MRACVCRGWRDTWISTCALLCAVQTVPETFSTGRKYNNPRSTKQPKLFFLPLLMRRTSCYRNGSNKEKTVKTSRTRLLCSFCLVSFLCAPSKAPCFPVNLRAPESELLYPRSKLSRGSLPPFRGFRLNVFERWNLRTAATCNELNLVDSPPRRRDFASKREIIERLLTESAATLKTSAKKTTD